MHDAPEAADRAALEDLHAAATADLRRKLGIESHRMGNAFVSIARGLPPSAVVINRACGLGLPEPASRATVDQVVDAYRRAGIERYFIHVHPRAGPADIPAWLEDAGLEKARGWMPFVRDTRPPADVTTDLVVRRAGPRDAAAFGRIVADAFDLGQEAAPWLAQLVGRPRWHIFMTFAGNEPAGAGALFVKEGVGWVDWGATLPPFRRRGSQGAIMQRRIAEAIRLGCRVVATETGEGVPGEPQHSWNNMIRMRFGPTRIRANYAPPCR